MSVIDQLKPVNQPETTPTTVEWGQIYQTAEALGFGVDAVRRADHLAHITGPSIIDVATKLHTHLAPDVDHEISDVARNIQSPDGVVVQTLLQPEERAPLMDYAANLVRQLGDNRQPGDEEAFLKRASNVIALSLVMAHPFTDGNGRTARTMAHLIREGYDASEEIQVDLKQVGSNRPPSGFRIFSFLPTGRGKDMPPQDLLTVAASADIPLREQAAYYQKSQEHFVTPYGD